MMHRRTKIVCTLGPAVASRKMIEQLIESGMNVARINCSHGSWEERAQWIEWIRELNQEVSPIGILVDLQGPKFRIGEVPNGALDLEAGQVLTITSDGQGDLTIPDPVIFNALESGDRMLLGDGQVELYVHQKVHNTYQARVVTTGTVKTRQGVTVLGKSFDVPALTDKDYEDIQKAIEHNVEFIALSYVRSAEDIIQLKKIVSKSNCKIKICAKIECRDAVNELDAILDASDVIMVARGDLGLQMEFEDVPIVQKQIIAKSSLAGKPVITATQMLESMIFSARPTRAEATDITNAILDGTDAIMLSAETASGRYPIEAVRTMARIAERAEVVFSHETHMERLKSLMTHEASSTESVAEAVVRLASSIHAKAIITTTTSGYTSLMVGKYRPEVPIYCATWNTCTQAQMSVVSGVKSILIPVPENTDESINYAIKGFKALGYLKAGDSVVITAGIPVGTPGHTNLIMVESINE
jgi:pyruvate kinase